MTPPALSPEQREEAAMLYTACGWTTGDIAEHFEVSSSAVLGALRANNVAVRPVNYRGPELKVKQCPRCLHFLPLLAFHGRGANRERLAAWCMDCTRHPRTDNLILNPAPLAQALNAWRN